MKKRRAIRGGPAKAHRKKEVKAALDALKPSAALLSKLGSMIVHADEAFSPDGREVDKVAFYDLLRQQDVQNWMKGMGALLPLKRMQR